MRIACSDWLKVLHTFLDVFDRAYFFLLVVTAVGGIDPILHGSGRGEQKKDFVCLTRRRTMITINEKC
jgi:hypothetical protein